MTAHTRLSPAGIALSRRSALGWAPRSRRLRDRLAWAALVAVLRRVPVRVLLPDGTPMSWPVRGGDGRKQATIEIVRPDEVARRLADHPKIGIGEAYMAGDWRAARGTDLADALLPFAQRMTTAVPPALRPLRRLVNRRPPRAAQANTPAGARENIAAHYDLSNELFAAFLDETLNYSSALFAPDRPWRDQPLAEAQRRKVDAVLDRAGVGPGDRVLEIGTGWGTLAIEAARRGATVTTLTLSAQQVELARRRVAEAGMENQVRVSLRDYREAIGEYDAVVSVEMIEAVGEEYWPVYFQTIDRLLAPGGRVLIQSILMSHDRFQATRDSYGWIQKHVFPGGLIPSAEAIEAVTTRDTTLRVMEISRFGQHYAETLRRWRQRFLGAWSRIAALGFDETFRRRWEFYLAYCQAGFASGYLDVAHLRLGRPVR